MSTSTTPLIAPITLPTGGLASLGLSASDLKALERQGFVKAEFRGERGPFFKLRFRLHGVQRVKYLGKDRAFADRIAEELAALQAPRQLDLELQRDTREAWQTMRRTKRRLAPLVKQSGRSFHGVAVRDRSLSERDTLTTPLAPFNVIKHGGHVMADANTNWQDDHFDVNGLGGRQAAAVHQRIDNSVAADRSLAGDTKVPSGPGLEMQLSAVLDQTHGILNRLGKRIVTAFDSEARDVVCFGSLPAATSSYSALARQFGSLAQLKLRVDRQTG